jgi:hypothetical protein
MISRRGRNTGFQTHLERRFTPGRCGGIGYTAGLETWAANTKNFMHRKTIVSRTFKNWRVKD